MVGKFISSMDKVFPERENTAAELVCAEGFTNEVGHLQLAYFYDGQPREAEVSVESPLAGIQLFSVELEPAEYIGAEIEPEGFVKTTPGMFPDILAPYEGSIRLLPGFWRSLWLDVKPGKAEPGTYPVTVVIRSGDEVLLTKTMEYTVLPGKLPTQKLLFTQWFYGDCIAQAYDVPVLSDAWWKLTETYVRFAAAHGMNMLLTPVFTPPLDTEVGSERLTVQLVNVMVESDTYYFDFSNLERWIKMAESAGIRTFECSHLFTQWGAEHAPKIMATTGEGYKRIFGWETDASGEEYTAFLKAFLPSLCRFLKRNGLAGRFYFHISDEPRMRSLEHYGKLSQTVHALIGDFPVMDALSDYDFYKEGYVDRPVCATEHIQSYLENKTEHLWAYYCGCQVHGVSNRLLGLSGERNRSIGVQLYHSGVEGFLHWGYNFWMTALSKAVIDPYLVSDAGQQFGAGDSFSVYPGPDGPYAAVSLKHFHEALQDLRALELAKEQCGEEAVEELLKDISWKDFSVCAKSPKDILDFRKKLNAMIVGGV